ncbi:uroporphyrinogen-III C-methyltransferase [Vibrio sp. ZSDZ34]|jgi:uroporphyrin-III C-methyltransferase|uniref:uroporphyrinogen-III C-methyltransferase n=1 Tax=Vibrio gelatinilyticus TaxID=2893468 RepID=A0A9X2AWF4_9VIBR|nr:uroporphyrinogen-III C-methyltransferase [Vibrio gelatinilyticus]MCJ2377216.1 uroporphyrinogen-III C-methyltransferase [Vibrio gelatinilyticus]
MKFQRHEHAYRPHQQQDSGFIDELPYKSEKGFVSIVGAGPGDPDLMTMAAHKRIALADIVVYDRLVSQRILDLIPSSALRFYVGKRCGMPSLNQESINAILKDCGQKGYRAVRLKGGDPFVFGRGGEEALALKAAHIEFEVIPGITAALGCSSSALIPLTHRKLARSVTFVTGNVVSGALPAWSSLIAQGQTLVCYMGLEKSLDIQKGLLQAGLRSSTPVAIIGKGCSPEQEVYTFQLSQMNQIAEQLRGLSPALMIIGEVVSIRQQLVDVAKEYVQDEHLAWLL